MKSPSDLTKVKAAILSGSAVFWIAIMVVYLERRGLALPQIYALIAVYYGAVVVLEFPTGALGDHFSHRVVAGIGYLLTAGFFIALGLAGSFWYYVACCGSGRWG